MSADDSKGGGEKESKLHLLHSYKHPECEECVKQTKLAKIKEDGEKKRDEHLEMIKNAYPEKLIEIKRNQYIVTLSQYFVNAEVMFKDSTIEELKDQLDNASTLYDF